MDKSEIKIDVPIKVSKEIYHKCMNTYGGFFFGRVDEHGDYLLKPALHRSCMILEHLLI